MFFDTIKFNHCHLDKNIGNEVTVVLYSNINLNILDYVKQSMIYDPPWFMRPLYKWVVRLRMKTTYNRIDLNCYHIFILYMYKKSRIIKFKNIKKERLNNFIKIYNAGLKLISQWEMTIKSISIRCRFDSFNIKSTSIWYRFHYHFSLEFGVISIL